MENKKMIVVEQVIIHPSKKNVGKRTYTKPFLSSLEDLRTLTLGGSISTPVDTYGGWDGTSTP